MLARTIGQTAYDSYFDAAGGRSLASGQTLPDWEKLNDATRNAWEAAAEAVMRRFPVALVASDTVSVPLLCDAIIDAVAVAEWAFGLAGHLLESDAFAIRRKVLADSLRVAQLSEDPSSRRLRLRLFPSEQAACDAFAETLCESGEAQELPSGEYLLFDADEFRGSASELFDHYGNGGFWIGSVDVC
jgi:hypothetical protein